MVRRPPRGLSRSARQNRRRVPGFPGTRLPPSPMRRSRRTGRLPRRGRWPWIGSAGFSGVVTRGPFGGSHHAMYFTPDRNCHRAGDRHLPRGMWRGSGRRANARLPSARAGCCRLSTLPDGNASSDRNRRELNHHKRDCAGNRLELACLPKCSPVSEQRYEETHTGHETSHYRRQRTWLARSSCCYYLTSGDIAVTNRQ